MLWDWLGDFKALEQEPVHSSEDRQSCPRIAFFSSHSSSEKRPQRSIGKERDQGLSVVSFNIILRIASLMRISHMYAVYFF